MKKEQIINTLCAQGMDIEMDSDIGCQFMYDGIPIVYYSEDPDEEFVRFGAPFIYEVCEENKLLLTDIANRLNIRLKYSKTCVFDDRVAVYYEHYVGSAERSDEDVEEMVNHILLLIFAAVVLFHNSVNGDDYFFNDDNDNDSDDSDDNGIDDLFQMLDDDEE